MIRVESNTRLEGFTEFEEEILFDDDDPDFDHTAAHTVHSILFQSDRDMLFSETRITLTSTVSSKMSLASVHPAELHSSHSSLALSRSLEELAGGALWAAAPADAVMTIEDLRGQLHCCFTCGVSWADSHVSLDCSECGGYAFERPCTECDGSCGAVFKRDVSTSHASGKARWTGECKKKQVPQEQEEDIRTTDTTVAQELSSRLEKLNANS